MTIFRNTLDLARAASLGMVALATSVQAHPDHQASAKNSDVLLDCRISDSAGSTDIEVLETDFDVRLREQATMSGKCADYARSHVMGHVYFYGGAAASIADDGALVRRPAARSSAKASEHICDGVNHSLTYATLVSPLRLIERKDGNYVGVFREAGTWTVAAFETDAEGRISRIERFLASDREIVAVGYFPHLDTNAGLLGLTVKGTDPNSVQLLTFAWSHRNFG